MAKCQEAMAETLARTWSEAQEAIARDLARAMAEAHARFEEIALTTRAAVAPGTMLGDYLTLAGEPATQSERNAALERFATALGGPLLLPPKKGGLRPRARQALRLLARYEAVPQPKILRQEIPVAVLEALAAFDEDQTRRDGETWRKDGSGRVLHFIPSENYTVPDLQGRARAHLRDLMRGCLEKAVCRRAGLSADPANDYEPEFVEWTETLAPSQSTEEVLLGLESRGARELALGAALSRLTPREREFFGLLELNPREIANNLGVSEDSVRRLRSDILKKFSTA
jgi:DNA-binding CsgD family transcriptional regulator